MGDRGIAYLESEKLRQVPGMKGTELGSGPYLTEIDKAIRRIRQGAVTDYRATKAEQQMSLEAQKSQFQRDLLSAETEDQRVQLAEQYEADLKQRAMAGDQAAFREYQSQVSIDNYNPNAFTSLWMQLLVVSVSLRPNLTSSLLLDRFHLTKPALLNRQLR